jgi:uncharacterized protein YpmS
MKKKYIFAFVLIALFIALLVYFVVTTIKKSAEDKAKADLKAKESQSPSR